MTVFDHVVIGIVGVSLVLGLWRGVVGEVIALVAWVLAFFAASKFGDELSAALFTGIAEPWLQSAAGFAAVFVGVLVLMALIRLAVRGMVSAMGLGLSDRLLGVVFGVARGLLISLVLVAIGGMTTAPRQVWWQQATLSAPMETAVLAAMPWLPADLAKRIRFK